MVGRPPRNSRQARSQSPSSYYIGPVISQTMHLTSQEERILAGEEGQGRQKALELLVALGDIYGAKRLIPIASAQVSGASFKTIGDAGIQFLEDFSAEAKATVPSSLNPLGLDLKRSNRVRIQIAGNRPTLFLHSIPRRQPTEDGAAHRVGGIVRDSLRELLPGCHDQP